MSINRGSRATTAAFLILLGACDESAVDDGSPGPFPPGYVAPAPTDDLPLVDHPEYANWSRFPVGTAVVRKKQVTNESGSVVVITTLRLLQKTAAKVIVQSQVTVDRAGQPLMQNPPLDSEFPASFRLPKGMRLEQFALPALKARPAGEETRALAGREYRAELFTWDERNETGPMSVKLWRSDEIPGRMLRQEISGPMHASIEEVVEITEPEAQSPARRDAASAYE